MDIKNIRDKILTGEWVLSRYARIRVALQPTYKEYLYKPRRLPTGNLLG